MVSSRITAIYVALLSIVFLALSLRIALARWRREEYLGEPDKEMTRYVRAHANFCENVPIALILLGSSEAIGSSATTVHILGCILLIARLLHAYGVSKEPEPIWFRVIGYSMTSLVIAVAAATILWQSLR